MEDSDSKSGAIIASNDDLLTEILIRLPVTSILRFKSVSKHWRSLLTNSRFTRRYDNNNNNNISKTPVFLVPMVYIIHLVLKTEALVFVVSISTLIVLVSESSNLVTVYYFVVPFTTAISNIMYSIPPLGKYARSMALAFDQTHSPHYKLVCVCAFESRKDTFQIHMYSSETMTWKICIESFVARASDFYHPVYWNGCVHWAPDYLNNNFLYFKLDVEELQMLPVLDELASSELSTMYFGESRGHLHLIPNTDDGHKILQLNVYEMLRDRSGWFVKYRVRFNELMDFPEMFDCDSGVVDVVRGKEEDEEEDDAFLVVVTPRRVMRYNVHDESFNPIYTHTDDYFYDDDTSRDEFYLENSICHRYVEALSSF